MLRSVSWFCSLDIPEVPDSSPAADPTAGPVADAVCDTEPSQGSSGFEFPPAVPPVVPDPVPEVVVPDPVPEVEASKIDWMAFFQEYLIPLIALLSGLFGGGFGVRFRDRRAGRKRQVDAVKSEGERVLSMLKELVPQLHAKIIDKDSRKRAASLARAKEALDEVVENGV